VNVTHAPATCRNSQRNGSRCLPCVHLSTMLKPETDSRAVGRNRFIARLEGKLRRWGWPASAGMRIKRLRLRPGEQRRQTLLVASALELELAHSANGLSCTASALGGLQGSHTRAVRRQASLCS